MKKAGEIKKLKILEVIDRVDTLYPNAYTMDEKLRWCDEINAMINQETTLHYDSIECTAKENEEIMLPSGVDFDNIECVYADGVRLDKTDLRSYGLFPSNNGVMPCLNINKIKLVFLKPPTSIRNIENIGTFDVHGNYIEMTFPNLEAGDTIDITNEFNSDDEPYYKNSERYYICSVEVNGIYLDRDMNIEGDNIRLAIRRIITDSTIVPPPYDAMYIEYILARMAHYQHDYNTYKACQTQFNSWLESFINWHKVRNSIKRPARFRRLWHM